MTKTTNIQKSGWNFNKKYLKKTTFLNIFMLILMIVISMNQSKSQGSVKPAEVTIKDLEIKELRVINHEAFAAGEELKYRLRYGFIDAAEATISVKNTSKKVRGREMLHVEGIGKTLKGFNWMFKVDDRYESYIDKEGVFPWIFVRRISEGGYKKSQDYTFHQHKHAVDNKEGKQFATPGSVQDMISSFYYARTLDFSEIKKDDVFYIETFMDDEIFTLGIKFVKKETIKLRAGEFRCLKFEPIVQEGRVFKSSEDLQVWITDDENKIPILAKAKVLVGSIKMELSEYKGLINPIAIVDD
ncbi:MAG: hypothetical protein ACI8XB_000112 [Patiriisocius sp.]|jgi:hypothetical protein